MRTNTIELLVVDDNREFAELVAEVAQSCGLSAYTVSSGEQFQTEFRKLLPAISVIDIGLDGIDGMALAQWLGMVCHEQNHKLKLIICSGRDEPELQICAAAASLAGVDDIVALHKPVEVASLTDALTGSKTR